MLEVVERSSERETKRVWDRDICTKRTQIDLLLSGDNDEDIGIVFVGEFHVAIDARDDIFVDIHNPFERGINFIA